MQVSVHSYYDFTSCIIKTSYHGVGLAIVHDIVNVYGGTIQFGVAKIGGLEVNIHFEL